GAERSEAQQGVHNLLGFVAARPDPTYALKQRRVENPRSGFPRVGVGPIGPGWSVATAAGGRGFAVFHPTIA
ncbi:hypothetical protein, partial [Stutzerimonas stutzeri]|uniref:hypothetical protein n=1 Tax=Stutzerimonas stutzeri TaxID=316 RepID=UPI001CFDD37E